MTPLSDEKSFYGQYVGKKNPVVPLETVRGLERQYNEECMKYRIAQGDIDRAHVVLDELNIPRRQKNSRFLLSLSGRLRAIKDKYKEII